MTDYTPSVDTTIFPRTNFLKTFDARFQARTGKGRVAMFFQREFTISGPTSVALADGVTAIASYTANRTVDTWSLTGANASLFSIDSNGVVTANSPTTDGSYVYVVNAAAAGEPTATLTVNVVVTEVDVTAPTVSGATSVNVSTGDTAVGTYTANEAVTWSLTGTDAGLFSITSGGVVSFNSASVDGTYSFTVNATDAAGNVGTLAVTTTVAAAPSLTFLEITTTATTTTFTVEAAASETYDVDWGDGTSESATGDRVHNYGSAGSYTIKITPTGGSTHDPNYFSKISSNRIASVNGLGGTEIDFMEFAFRGCTNITSFGPDIDLGSVTSMYGAFFQCSNLTSFGATDLSSCQNFIASWRLCNLSSFPTISFSSGTNFNSAWDSNPNLTDFGPNCFDTLGTLLSSAFSSAFNNCALTAQSIENILVSLDTSGATNQPLGIKDGTNAGKSTWTAAANTAYTNLVNKGWTITHNA